MAKKDTTKTSVHRKLEQLGTNLINQANNNKALKKIGKTKDIESLRDALNNIFEGGGTFEAWIYAKSWGESNTARIASKSNSNDATEDRI